MEHLLSGCIEPIPVEDVFITGAIAVEDLGSGMIRIWLGTKENNQTIIKAKLVVPIEKLAEMRAFCAIQSNAIIEKRRLQLWH